MGRGGGEVGVRGAGAAGGGGGAGAVCKTVCQTVK